MTVDLRIPLSTPDLDETDIASVVEVLRSGRLSLGPKLLQFESVMAAYMKSPHAIAVSSGTAGLHLTLLALGIGEGDQVLVPSFAFVAAANAIRHAGAQPVFIDIDRATYNLDPAKLVAAITPRTRALLVVHTFGYPAPMEAILALCRRHRLYVIEDACEAIGAIYQGQKVGSMGHAGVFSFYPNKPITTGEGGVIVTQDASLAATLRALRNQGRGSQDDWLTHSIIGYNCRLNELSCALGITQLARLENILAARSAIAKRYAEGLASVPQLVLPPLTLAQGRASPFVYVVRLVPEYAAPARDQVIARLTNRGIGSRAYFPPIHHLPSYRPFVSPGRDLSETEHCGDRTFALPFSSKLSPTETEEVVDVLTEILRDLAPDRVN